MPSLRSFPLDFGIIRSRTGNGRERAGLQIGPQVGEEQLHPAHVFDVVGGQAVHSGRARTPIAPHPRPGHRQERGIDDQVEQVVKPASSVLAGPSVQLGLDLQYPDPVIDRTRRVGVHRRPPDLPAPALRTRCRPWPCGRLSRPRTTTAAPPHQRGLGGRCACPRPARLAEPTDASLMVPTFTTHRLTGWVPSSSPAASPRLPRSTSSWPPARPTHDLTRSHADGSTVAVCTADRPRSVRFEPAVHFRGFHHWFLHSCTSPSHLTGPGRLTVPTRPAVVGAASHPHPHLRAQAAPSFVRLLRQPNGEGLSPPHGAVAPRGARGCSTRSGARSAFGKR